MIARDYWLQALLPGLLAAAVTMLLTPAVIWLAVRLQAVDIPGGRKRHKVATPRLGGIAIFVGILLSLGPGLVIVSGRTVRALSPAEIFWFLVALLIVFGLGVADDFVSLGAVRKLFFQVLAAAIVVAMGWQFSALRLPLEGRFDVGSVAAPVLSLLWIVGVTNAINFIDGLDGLAAGIVAIISSSLLVMAILQRSPETVVATSCIAGACVGFLRHNWKPAKIYMGDSGSLILGFLLATISLRFTPSLKASAAVAILVPVLALGLPVFDTLMVMWYRFLRGHRHMNRIARMFHADRAHLHHLLLDNKTERHLVVLTLYGLTTGFCLMAVLVAASDSLWLGLSCLSVGFAAVLSIRWSGLNAEARRLAEERLKLLERCEEEDESPRASPVLETAEASTK